MATEQKHREKAESNKKFREQIPEEFPDWLAIVAFYEAVHIVETLLARYGIHSKSHTSRNEEIKKRFPIIWEHYLPLYNVSRLVRYTPYRITIEQAREHMVDHRLAAVRRLVAEAIKDLANSGGK